jgi:hypothetical protein
MMYTKNGSLMITLDELEKLLDYAKSQAENNSMEHCIYIKGGDRPKITQYCCYHECNPINHTYGARLEG